MSKSQIDLNKMNGLLASKGTPVVPATDAVQRGYELLQKDEKTKASNNVVNLSFKVPSEFRKKFKLAAVNAGITQNELVQQALVAWENTRNNT